jgi:hypothetical protein
MLTTITITMSSSLTCGIAMTGQAVGPVRAPSHWAVLRSCPPRAVLRSEGPALRLPFSNPACCDWLAFFVCRRSEQVLYPQVRMLPRRLDGPAKRRPGVEGAGREQQLSALEGRWEIQAGTGQQPSQPSRGLVWFDLVVGATHSSC